jgi:high-affinity iron transporter
MVSALRNVDTEVLACGASRELTEGFGSIFAAVVLLSVGIWMHGKAQADAWQRYVREKLNRALNERSGWFLFGLAFVVVYREAFETILFYAAMWEDSPGALLAGVCAGAALLGAIAWAMLRYSAKLPIAQFFRYSSILMAVLAVILAGKGIGALQEAGLLGVTPLAFVPSVDWIGLEPSLQVVLAQLAAVIALVIGFAMNRPPRRPDPA